MTEQKQQNTLRAAHWQAGSTQAKFEVQLAANNSPGMGMGTGQYFKAEAVILVKRAYNLIAAAANLRRRLVEHGFYDIDTDQAIADFQKRFFPADPRQHDGIAGAKTLLKMDELLLELEQVRPLPQLRQRPWLDLLSQKFG